jgi:WD40 repeat protein
VPLSPDGERYERELLLGAGGMGEVWLAHDRHLDRRVAIKEGRPGEEAGLLDEARLTAALEHPGIVAVHDVGVTPDGRAFYAMRLIRGRSLADVVRGAPDLDQRLRLLKHVLDACQAVAWAHAQGRLHRDLKPANVMIGEFGETQVLDWGLGTAEADQGGVIGTPAYMSPEQARGERSDARTDVWGLGCLLYELLAGHAPYEGASTGVVLAHAREGAVPRLAGTEPRAPAELAAITERAMAADPADRYPSARAMVDDLTRYMAGDRIEAHTYTARELLLRLMRAWRGPLTVAAVGTVVLIVVGVLSAVRLTQERNRALAAESQTRAALERSDQSLQRALVAQSVMASQDGQWPQAHMLAAEALQLGPSPDARGVLVVAGGFRRMERLEVESLAACATSTLGSAGLLCADGARISARADGVERWSWPSAAMRLFDAGELVVGQLPEAFEVRDQRTGDLRANQRFLGGTTPIIANAAGWLAAQRTDRRAWVTDLRTGEETWTEYCPGHGRPAWIALHSTRAERAVLCDDGLIQVGRVDGPATTFYPTPFTHDHDGGAGVFTYDAGDDLLIGTNRGSIGLVDGHTGEVRVVPGVRGVRMLAGSPDGALLAVLRTHGPIALWERSSLEPVAHVPVLGVTGLRFRVDGTLDVTAADRTRWRIPTEGRPTVLRAPEGVATLDWSADGERLLSGHGGGQVWSWEADTGRVLGRWTLPGAALKSALYAADDLIYAVVGGQPGIFRIEGEEQELLAPSFGFRRLVPTWDGGLLGTAFGPEPDRILLDRHGDKLKEASPCPRKEWIDAATSPDRDRVVLTSPDGTLATIRRGTCEALVQVEHAVRADVANDGRLAVISGDRISLLERGSPVWHQPLTGALDVVFSPDGRLLATGGMDADVQVYDAGTGELIARLLGHGQRVAVVAFSPDGRTLASGSWDGTVRLWSMERLADDPVEVASELVAAGYSPVSDIP